MTHARARRGKRGPPQGEYSATIDALAHDGRGLAHIDGKAVFIHGALPGERVSFTYRQRHSQYDEGSVSAIAEASPERVPPRCAHFGVCGGCSLQHLDARRQIAYKQDWLLDNLARIGKVEPEQVLEPLLGPAWGYRHKARIGVKYVQKKNRVLIGFRERDAPLVADLRRCEVLHPKIGGLLEELAELIGALSIRERLPQVEVAVGDTAAALSFRVLDPPNAEDEAKLADFGARHDIQIYLQPKGPATTHLLWPRHAELSYRLPGHGAILRFLPYHFIQINAAINQNMVLRVLELLDLGIDDHVLDLYCGLGNFTLALAPHAATVVGVEGEREAVEWARRNAAQNGIANAEFVAADLAGPVVDESWLRRRYAKILLDPPRSGAWEMLPHIAARQAERVVYVSCHPATLARDAGELVHRHGYRLARAGVMDMFPHTAHVESIALFERP
ncbi:MAG: 23S rRNA (uracil(1939)-C(5))-methyltransferase RlmD [Gammaproteobacteria bacterium]